MKTTYARLHAFVIALALLLVPAVAFAEDDPLAAYRSKVVTFINELSTTGLILLPLVIGLAILVVAIMRAVDKTAGGKNIGDHDDRIKHLIGYLVVGESATAFVAIVSYFFK